MFGRWESGVPRDCGIACCSACQQAHGIHHAMGAQSVTIADSGEVAYEMFCDKCGARCILRLSSVLSEDRVPEASDA